jgi:branched-chain amino acid transport system permease protein
MFGRAALVAFLVVLAAVPLIAPQFYVTLGNYIGLYSMVALGLVLLTGVAGQTSFGQAAFVGLGAYTSAYLTTRYGTSPWLTLAIGIAITLLVALFLGFITLRMKGHYLPLATIAWGISLYYVFGNLEMLGGHTGMTGIPALSLFGFELKDERRYFYLIWLLVLAAFGPRTTSSIRGRAVPSARSAGGSDMVEAFGVDCRALEDRRVRLRRAARMRLGMAVRAPAAIREPDAVRHQPGHRVSCSWQWSAARQRVGRGGSARR